MIRTCLAIGYFSYLVSAGVSMAGGISKAEHASAAPFKANVCQLIADTAGCQK